VKVIYVVQNYDEKTWKVRHFISNHQAYKLLPKRAMSLNQEFSLNHTYDFIKDGKSKNMQIAVSEAIRACGQIDVLKRGKS
jgi:hypothetical protein